MTATGTDYRGDCGRCAALCCVLPGFDRSAYFAVDKPAGTPCRNLTAGASCGIHDRLRPAGFAGCAVYDCFGAGQQVTAAWLGGDRDVAAVTDRPGLAEAFGAVRQLREMGRYLDEALALQAPGVPHDALGVLLDRTRACAEAAAVGEVADVTAHRAAVAPLLRAASAAARAARRPSGRRDLAGHDLVGAGLAGADLRAAELRGALLIGADLRAADLRDADLLGADLRGARLHGADLTGALFVTEPQLTSADADGATTVPAGSRRPPHWS